MKLYFHPGTDMAQAMAETVGYVNRARAFMPPGTVPPFIMRFDTGSVPVGYLVLSSETQSIGEIQDMALFRVRPMFASLPGVSAPPPFGGSQRTIVVHVDPDRLRAYNLSPDEVVAGPDRAATPSARPATSASTTRCPSCRSTPWWCNPQDLGNIPIRPGCDVLPARPGRRHRGRRPTSPPATPWSTAGGPSTSSSPSGPTPPRWPWSTRSSENLPKMQAALLPEDIKVSFEFDQSPYVTGAMWGVGTEGLLGAVLTGLMVLLFLRDWRSVIVVVLNIPFALLGAVVGLWLTGQTINLMTLGGLALAVGILVDEATVEVENIHTQMEHTPSMARAVLRGQRGDGRAAPAGHAVHPGGVHPVVLHARRGPGLFVPLSLAVGFSMITSYLLSSTFVPVLSVWLLRGTRSPTLAPRMAEGRLGGSSVRSLFGRLRALRVAASGVLRLRLVVVRPTWSSPAW